MPLGDMYVAHALHTLALRQAQLLTGCANIRAPQSRTGEGPPKALQLPATGKGCLFSLVAEIE